jgi:hypothetical protein
VEPSVSVDKGITSFIVINGNKKGSLKILKKFKGKILWQKMIY